MSTEAQQRVAPFLDRIRRLPFVKRVDVAGGVERSRRAELLLDITDRTGRVFRLNAEVKTSYLDRAAVNGVIANARLAQKQKGNATLVLARYVPLPTAEQLLDAGLNFVDLAGNMHLVLGKNYERTVMGRVEHKGPPEKQRVTPAQLQLLFLFATRPEAPQWTVRDIAAAAGVSKSMAAEVRSEIPNPKALEQMLVSGYAQTLRPKLVLGRFRAPDREIPEFLRRVPEAFGGAPNRYALTGGPAAEALQHFHRGPEAPLFVSGNEAELRQRLRLLPDREGPITLLHAFGEVVYWRKAGEWTVAPPWLIYSELLYSEDPRAHEAAAELRQEFLA